MAADETEEEDVTTNTTETPTPSLQWEQPSTQQDTVDDGLTVFDIYLLQCGPDINTVRFKLPKHWFLAQLKDPRNVIANQDPDRTHDEWIISGVVTDFCADKS